MEKKVPSVKNFPVRLHLHTFFFVILYFKDEKKNLGSAKSKTSRPHSSLNESDLKKKSDKSLNVQLLKTAEEIKSTKKEISRLKASVERNAGWVNNLFAIR